MSTKSLNVKNPELYIIKSKTYKAQYIKYYPYRHVCDLYAERYLAKGKLKIIQMNSINFDRNKLLIFKDKATADVMCKIANETLKRLTIYSECGVKELNDYEVVKYTPKKEININALITTPLIGGTAYTIG